MKRWKKWFLWSTFTLIVMTAAGYLTMNIAVSYVLKSVVPTVKFAAPKDITNEIDVNSTKDLQSELVQPKSKNSSEVPYSDLTAASVTRLTNSSNDNETTSNSENQPSSPNLVNNEKTPVPTLTPKDQVLSYTPQVTVDKAKVVEESISLKEKAEVSSIILKKLSPAEIQTFLKMAGNGLSVEEKKKAKEVMLKKLTEDEYNQLVKIAAKYGLSQGKDYQHAKKRMEQSKQENKAQ